LAAFERAKIFILLSQQYPKMKFSEVIGQDELKTKLLATAQAGRVAHALMFFGPDGCGSLPLAIAYAQYIACIGEKKNDSCGTCSSCNKFSRLIHPDLHFVFPVNTTKNITKDPVSDDFLADWRVFVLQQPYFQSSDWYDYIGIENKQGVISKKDSESIIRKLSLKPFESDYKFMFIWLPEKMNASSANVLLKLMEEPPDNTLFFLVSEEPEQVLLTISSRTQPVKLSRIGDEALSTALLKKYTLTENNLKDILRLANGSFVQAMNAVQTSEENRMNFERFVSIMRLGWARNFLGMNDWVEEISGLGREKLKSFFEYSIRLVRENFMTHLQRPELVYMTAEERNFAVKFHQFLNGTNVIAVYDEMNKASADIERNGYAKIVLFDFVLRLVKLIRNG
jgi:DNA polymerase-3 subunit delta'